MVKEIRSFDDIPRLTSDGNYQVDVPLSLLQSWVTEKEEDDYYKLQLCLLFQRGHVWSEEQQSAYVEYLLRGGKSATTIYFNFPGWLGNPSTEYNDFVCVGGLQRVTALLKFLNNELRVFGKLYKEFEGRLSITRHCISVNINNLQTEKEVLKWYIEMNEGGTPHSKEELNRVRELYNQLN